MESSRALAAAEKRRLMDLARSVPETLLLVGTTEKVFASIKAAHELLGENNWWGFGIAGLPKPPPISAGGVSDGGGLGFGGVPVNTTCGFYDMASAHDFSFSADLQYQDPAPYFPADLLDKDTAPTTFFSADHLDDDTAPATYYFLGDFPDDDAAYATYISTDLLDDDAASAPNLSYAVDASGPDYWANLLATALAPNGPLPGIYGEITRLVSLHEAAGRVLFVCAARLGIQPGGAHNLGGQPDADAAWKRWRDLGKSVVGHAHDALLRLKDATSAVAAAVDFIRWRPLESPVRNEWSAAARQLVRDARRSLDEVKESVRLMRDAAVREYFETWMILNRASLEC